MNEKLRFSWGHIIAFLALIFIAYVVFMGTTYYTLGNYIIAGLASALSVILLIITIIGAQILKGTSSKFYKCIVWERVLLFLSFPVVLIVFIPFNNFWNVLSNEDKIATEFRRSINYAKEIFVDYENYAADRHDILSEYLLTSDMTDDYANNRLECLDLILVSKNYKTLKTDAYNWIDNASQSPSVWNIFLFGNK